MKHVWVISLESKRYSFESCDMRVICMQNLTCVLSGVACSRSGFFKKQFMRCNVLCETTKALPTWMMLWLKGPVTNDKATQNKHAIYIYTLVTDKFVKRSSLKVLLWLYTKRLCVQCDSQSRLSIDKYTWTSLLSHIHTGNFRGRKLSHKKHSCGYLQKCSP